MTKAKAITSVTTYPAPVVLFGIDSRGKPKAARFGKQHAALAAKAASQLQLHVLANDNAKIAEIAARLPVGRVHATGKTFVPFIRRDLYESLVAVACNGKDHPHPSSAATASVSAPKPGGSTPNLPESWDKIGIGDLVVAQESQEDGWYAAFVIEASGDMFTLRWRDYPRERRFVRHRNRLALLYPAAKPTAESQKSAKANPMIKPDKPAASPPAVEPKPLPKHWSEIDVGHLVLAPSDGPSRDWWEAVPIEQSGDVLTLRWRDVPSLLPITRSRFDLALICPEPA